MSTTPDPNERDEAAFLSPEERDAVQRMLGFPEEFPRKFGAWMLDYMLQNGQITQAQVVGLSLLTARYDTVLTSETTSSLSYTDLSTAGPTLTGLGDGTYLILFGCQMTVVANIWGGAMSVSVNGAAATDADGFSISMTTAEGVEVEAYNLPGMRAVLKEVRNEEGGNNTIQAKHRYVGGTNPSYSNRWLVAIKVGN